MALPSWLPTSLRVPLLRAYLWALLLGFGVVVATAASETDSFTERNQSMPDVTEVLNRRTNELLDQAVAAANAPPPPGVFADATPKEPPCSRRRLYDEINQVMGGPLVGTLEEFANGSASLAQRKLSRRESIYHAFGIFEAPSMGGDEGRLAAVVNIAGTLVGADKLGHFFSQGYSYFDKAYLSSGGLDAALDYGDLTERTYYGALLTGVYSYADLTANFDGMRFWIHVLGEQPDPLGDDGRSPYVSCQDSRWARTRDFDWRDYVSPAWDEAINCSLFRNQGLQAKVRQAIAELERRYEERLSCPVSRHLAPVLRAKYGPYFSSLVNLKGQGVLEPLLPLSGFSIFPSESGGSASPAAEPPSGGPAVSLHPH